MTDYPQIRPIRSSVTPSDNSFSKVYEDELDSSGFGNILSNLLTSSNAFSSTVGSSSTTDLLTPILLLLVSKLFGSEQGLFTGTLSASEPHGKPLTGVITQGSHAGHTALDFGVPVGTNVKSTMSGNVVYAGWNNEGYGNLVIIENGDYRTYYAHLSKIPVKLGQTVKNSETIGYSGNTGNSTGPHLHYEVRKNGLTIDPSQTLGV